MDIFLFLFSVWSFYAEVLLRKVSLRYTECRRCNTRKEKWHVRTDTRNNSINLAPRFFWPFIRVLLSRVLLPCSTVKWPFRRSVRSIGCRSSCRCGRRRRQTWFSGICDTWRSAQPRPFCVSPNASVSFLRGPAPHLAFVYRTNKKLLRRSEIALEELCVERIPYNLSRFISTFQFTFFSRFE